MGRRPDGTTERKHLQRRTKAELRDVESVLPMTARWKTLSTYRSQMRVHVIPALARKVANVVGSHPEDAEGSETSQQAHEVAETVKVTTEDALRIAQKAVEMASKIAQAPSGRRGTPTG